MYYLLIYEAVPDYIELRAPFRDAHLALAKAAQECGELLLGGALADPVDQAILLFEGDSPKVCEKFVEQDPYVQNGLVSSWNIREWTLVAGAGVRSF